MLQNHKLLIDKHCPMCKVYGKGFTQCGLVDADTVSYYQTVADTYAQHIDMERAKNEIALYETTTTQTTYGIDAMIKIVSNGNDAFRKFLHSSLVYPFLLRLYRFISYNRKVIYPTAPQVSERDCTPEVNVKYRWLYILMVAVFTGVVLNQFAFYVNTGFGFEHNWVREYIVCFGQIAWQLIAISFVSKDKVLDYLGNMSTVSMIGGLLLLPLLLVNQLVMLSPLVLLAYFVGVVGLMFLEHIRRCKLLGVSLNMTASWVTYRMIVLGIILMMIF